MDKFINTLDALAKEFDIKTVIEKIDTDTERNNWQMHILLKNGKRVKGDAEVGIVRARTIEDLLDQASGLMLSRRTNMENIKSGENILLKRKIFS